MVGKRERMKELINKIEKYNFECEGCYLRGCQEWIDLKKEIEELEAIEKLEPCENAKQKNHIERMEEEAQELEEKIKKLEVFLSKEMEEKKYTDEYQRQLLAIQKDRMIGYYCILLERIYVDKKKMEKTEK